MSIYICGPENASYMPTELKKYLKDLINKNQRFIIGDNSGTDRLVQLFLRDECHYDNVAVYTSGKAMDNFFGNVRWDIVCLNYDKNLYDDIKVFNMLKDITMLKDCDSVIMIHQYGSDRVDKNMERIRKLNKEVKIFFNY